MRFIDAVSLQQMTLIIDLVRQGIRAVDVLELRRTL